MRRPSKYVLRTELDAMSRDMWIYRHALRSVQNETPQAIERVHLHEPGTWYDLAVYGAERSHGGIVIVKFHCAGQADTWDAYYWDDYARVMHASAGSDAYGFAVACDKLTIRLATMLSGAYIRAEVHTL